MSSSIDHHILAEIRADAKRARDWGLMFIMGGVMLQALLLISVPIAGFTVIVLTSGAILVSTGIVFYLGSTSVPNTRSEVFQRLLQIMGNDNPKRRLWAAQRLVGYMKEANLTNDELFGVVRQVVTQVKDPQGNKAYATYISSDHIILLREIAVGVPMNKHVRKEFVRMIRPLEKVEGFSDEIYEVLADAIAYHPSKLPVQAYIDYKNSKENDEDKSD